MPSIGIILCLILVIHPLVASEDQYQFSRFDLRPDYVILKSTSITKFICTKQIDDDGDFEITTIPQDLSDNLQIYENRLNSTMIEITLDSQGYIGTFRLICSAIGNQSVGTSADVIIGTTPNDLTHLKPCIVYDNRFIDCLVRTSTMISAMENRYPYSFDFLEIRSTGMDEDAYHQPVKIVEINNENKTIRFRWFPKNAGVFPSGTKMIISATLRFFETVNLTINMTPRFLIKPNFTIELVTYSTLQIHMNHHSLPSSSVCHGNLTFDENARFAKLNDDTRRFKTTKSTVLHLTHLSSTTWYKICVQCQSNTSSDTISEIQCLRQQTKQSASSLPYVLLSLGLLVIFIILMGILIRNGCEFVNCVKRRIAGYRRPRDDFPAIVINPPQLNSNIFMITNPLFDQSPSTDDTTRDTTATTTTINESNRDIQSCPM